MKRLVAAICLSGLCGAEWALADVNPTPGGYNYLRIVGNDNANACKFSGEPVPNKTEISNVSAGGFNVDFIAQFPDGDFPFASTPCQYNGSGNGFTCTWDEQVNDFTLWGFDAVMTIDGATWHGAWMSNTRFGFTAGTPASTHCTGSDCDLIASFFGPDFEFGCTADARGYHYVKN